MPTISVSFYQVVVLILGVACIISSIAKTWICTPTTYDWFVLGMGVILCGLSLFRRVSLTAGDFKAELERLRELTALLDK